VQAPGALPEDDPMARILIIDDDAYFRALLRRVLVQAGHEAVEACDGREGVQRYRTAPTDLILTDIWMPEQEGLETIRALRREFPAVNIIAMSGSGQFRGLDVLRIAEQFGALHTLEKPSTWEAFAGVVHAVLTRRDP
jgi:CheY-like chemotaxis protein